MDTWISDPNEPKFIKHVYEELEYIKYTVKRKIKLLYVIQHLLKYVRKSLKENLHAAQQESGQRNIIS